MNTTITNRVKHYKFLLQKIKEQYAGDEPGFNDAISRQSAKEPQFAEWYQQFGATSFPESLFSTPVSAGK